MAETTITYNGITIKNVLTESIDQDVVPEGTGVNPLYVRVVVSCTGIVHNAAGPLTIGVDPPGGNLADGFNQIVDELMQPGRAFLMMVGGTPLFDVYPGHVRPGLPNPNQGDTIDIRKTDVNHGPLPSLKVISITSGHSMRIHFSVVMHLPYTDEDGSVPGGAISLRFWITEDIDGDDWTTERTYEGVFRVRHLGHNVLTEIRNNFHFPALVEGFQRKHIHLAQSPNGLELHFTIRDKEVWAVPPFPATSWKGKQTMFMPEPGGVMLSSEVYVRVKGDKATPKRDLLSLVLRIMDQKLHRIDFSRRNLTIVRALRIEDNFTDNEIEMSAVINLTPTKPLVWNIEESNFAKPLNVGVPGVDLFPLYKKDKADLVYPTACIQGLFLAALQDPLHLSGFPFGNEPARQITYGYINCPLNVVEGVLDENKTKLSPSQKSSSYQMFRMENETKAKTGYIQLPLGKQSGGTPSPGNPGGDTAILLRLHRDVAECTLRIEAERINAWPNLPTAQEYNKLGARFTPLSVTITPSAPVLAADHLKTLFHSRMELRFGQNREALEIPAGLLPYRIDNNPSAEGVPSCFAMPASVFQSSGILFA